MSTNQFKRAQRDHDAEEDPRYFFEDNAPETNDAQADESFALRARTHNLEAELLKLRQALAERNAVATADRAEMADMLRAVLKLLTAGESRAAIHLIRAELGEESAHRMPPDAAAAIRAAIAGKITSTQNP